MKARIDEDYKNDVYKVYISETLKMITESNAKIAGGKVMDKSYIDLINKKEIKEESPEEIITRFVKAGIIRKGGDER